MPFGVSQDFLTLAHRARRDTLFALGPIIFSALAGAFAAEMLDAARAGRFFLLYAGSLLAGLASGGLLGWLETRSWAESLKASWSAWMHSAVGAGSMAEAAKRAGALRVPLGRAATALLVVLNAACLIAAWFVLPPFTLREPYGALAIVAVVSTGLVVGALATLRLVEAWWCHEVETQTLTLVRSGRVGVWGIR